MGLHRLWGDRRALVAPLVVVADSSRCLAAPVALAARLASVALVATTTMVALATLTPAPAHAAEPSCAGLPEPERAHEEQLRVEDHSTSLPDCRAYELVSPPFAEGNVVEALGSVVAGDGSAIVFNSVGAFGGVENDETTGARYLATRTSSGWSALPIEPPSSQFQVGHIHPGIRTLDFNPELTQSLFAATPVGSPEPDFHFYSEQLTAGLPFVQIGPAFSPVRLGEWTGTAGSAPAAEEVAYLGASSNLSRVLFRIQAVASVDWLWPGDETASAHPSLYEYSGTGNSEPVLVGVKPGTGAVESRAAEHPALLSQCGILLGSQTSTENPTLGSSDDTYNAVSEDGSRVFFTAVSTKGCGGEGPAFDEVYARTNGSVTTAISEPSKADCNGCDTEAAAQSGAYFQGASSDGSKVFFLSEQKLFAGREGEAGDDLYEFNFEAPEGVRASLLAPDMASSKGERSGVMSVTENGKFVYLVSEDDELASNADALAKTPKETVKVEEAQGKHTHDLMYLFNTDTRQFTFIAPLAQSDQSGWNDNGTRRAEATPDGRFLLVGSSNDLTPGAEGAGSQLYRFDAEPTAEEQAQGVPRLVRVSIGQEGYDHDGNTGDIDDMTDPEHGGIDNAEPRAVSITNDGTRVFFESEAALVNGALNNACVYVNGEGECTYAINVYEWEQAGIGSGAGGCPQSQTAGCVYLISPPDDHVVLNGSTVKLIGADATGENVFFTTADDLVGQDSSEQQSIYDARVDGGFPAPATPAACSEEACQGEAPPPPSVGPPASATFTGPGNLTQPALKPATKPKPAAKKKAAKCPKGKVRNKKGKCVRVKAKRRK